MIATLCHAVSTAIEYKVGTKNAKEAVFDRGIFVATNLIAELLVAISSKGHGEGVVSDKSVDNTALSLAADIIVKQSPQQQDELNEHVAQFLSRPDVLAMKNDAVKEQDDLGEAVRRRRQQQRDPDRRADRRRRKMADEPRGAAAQLGT